MRRIILVPAVTVAALGLVTVGAVPASAAELPASDVLHPITSDAYYSATSTGASTFIADLPAAGGGKYGADFDVATGIAYYFSSTSEACDLYSIVPATGVATLVGPISDPGIDECDALNVALDGTLRVADQDGVMVTVDKATGAVLSSVTVAGVEAISFIEQSSTGQFYIGDYNGSIYTLDVATGATEFIAQPVDYIETASLDSANTLWFSTDGDLCQGLGSLSLDDPSGSVQTQGDFFDGEECLSAYALFIAQATAPAPAPVPAPAPQLAATGSAPSTLVVSLGALVLLLGAGLVAQSARVRKA